MNEDLRFYACLNIYLSFQRALGLTYIILPVRLTVQTGEPSFLLKKYLKSRFQMRIENKLANITYLFCSFWL